MAYIDEINKEVTIAPIGAVTYIRLSQNEDGRKLTFEIIGDEIPTGSTVTLSGTKPDGAVYSVEGTISGNTATFIEDIQMTVIAGTWDAKLRVYNNGRTVATGRIRFVIDADTVDYGSVPSDSQIDGIIAEIQAYAETFISGAEDLVEDEEAARIAAINAEASARQSADNNLQSQIDTEESARQSADANLQTQINNIQSNSMSISGNTLVIN